MPFPIIELIGLKAHVPSLLGSCTLILAAAIGVPGPASAESGADRTAPVSQTPIPPGAPFVKVTRTIARPIGEVFDQVMNVDLTRIFPSLVATTVPTGFHNVGQQRTNTLQSGDKLTETLTVVERPYRFGYRMFDFTAPALSENLSHIEGGWVFTDNGNGTTSIEWIYAFVPKSPEHRAFVESKLAVRYQPLLEGALDILKTDIES